MSAAGEKAAAWVYRGIWGVLVDLLNVPPDPPNTPPGSGEVRSLKPSPGFLRYLKFQFWVWLVLIDVVIIALWIAVLVTMPVVGLVIAPLAWGVAIIPDVFAYIAIHVRWDTTWYIITDRAVRIRRGVWIIRENTITFENVQNVEVRQGPLQRYFGIANVHVQTAGGGAVGPHGASTGGHHGLLEGVADAEALRQLILDRAGISRTAGLGDEHPTAPVGMTAAHRRVLIEIRDLLAPRAGESPRST